MTLSILAKSGRLPKLSTLNVILTLSPSRLLVIVLLIDSIINLLPEVRLIASTLPAVPRTESPHFLVKFPLEETTRQFAPWIGCLTSTLRKLIRIRLSVDIRLRLLSKDNRASVTRAMTLCTPVVQSRHFCIPRLVWTSPEVDITRTVSATRSAPPAEVTCPWTLTKDLVTPLF